MQIRVNIYITAAGMARAFLIQDEKARYPEVIGVGRTLPSAVLDYAACFNQRQAVLPEAERTILSTADILPSRRMVRRFRELWALACCQNGE